jgi:hypothetical protein
LTAWSSKFEMHGRLLAEAATGQLRYVVARPRGRGDGGVEWVAELATRGGGGAVRASATRRSAHARATPNPTNRATCRSWAPRVASGTTRTPTKESTVRLASSSSLGTVSSYVPRTGRSDPRSRLEQRLFLRGCERHGGAIRAPTRPCLTATRRVQPELAGAAGEGAKGWDAAGPETPPLSRARLLPCYAFFFYSAAAAAFRVVYCEPQLVLASLLPPLHAARRRYGAQGSDQVQGSLCCLPVTDPQPSSNLNTPD